MSKQNHAGTAHHCGEATAYRRLAPWSQRRKMPTSYLLRKGTESRYGMARPSSVLINAPVALTRKGPVRNIDGDDIRVQAGFITGPFEVTAWHTTLFHPWITRDQVQTLQ
jgi:hypothetical protein